MASLMELLIGERWPEYLRLVERVTALMGTQEQFDDRMKKIDAASSEIANDLKALRDEIKAGGPISDASLAMLDARIEVLDALGKDPELPGVTE